MILPAARVFVPVVEIGTRRNSCLSAERYAGRQLAGKPDYKDGRRRAPRFEQRGLMDIIGIDISKAKFDATLLVGERIRHVALSNTEAGFDQLLAWLARHRPDPAVPLHACMEATGNYGP